MTGTFKKQSNQPFRLILPDQKRLRTAFDQVLAQAGFDFERGAARTGQGVTRDLRGELPALETYELRADAALDWINDNAADMAVVGEDMLRERRAGGIANIRTILTMGRVSACSLWFAAKPEMYIRDLSDLGDMRIATAYPELLQQILAVAGVKPSRIITQKGNVESTIAAGRADAILEIVQTGESLAANGLECKMLAFNSSATLVRCQAQQTQDTEALIKAIASRIDNVLADEKPIECRNAPARRFPALLPAA